MARTENEKRESVEIVVLEMLGAAKALTAAHASLIMGHNQDARVDLDQAKERINEAIKYLPKELDE